MSPSPVRLDWHLSLPTHSLEAAWAVFSDTDRFNRAANLGFSFREEVDETGERRKVGEVKRLGMTLTWIDEPFIYIAPRQFVSVRRFHNGPVERLEATMRLTPGADGVQLDYSIELTPRSAVARLLLLIDAATSIRPSVGRTLAAAASQLGEAPQAYSPPPPLSAQAANAVQRLRDLPSGEALERTLREADLREQNRLRPRALAEAWSADPNAVIEDMLVAVERGVLDLRFDLLCPRCQGASTRRPILDVRPTDLHCESCGIVYDGSFPDSIEVSFRPSSSVRAFEVPVDCANSPIHAPHRLLRERLRAAETLTFEIELEPGAYRLDLEPRAEGASLEVREGLRDQRVAIDITERGIVPSILRVGPGKVHFALRNRLTEPRNLTLEQRWRPPHALTVGQLLERPDALELLPDKAVPPSLQLNMQRAAILVIDGRSEPKAMARVARRLSHGATQTSTSTTTQTRRDDLPVADQLADDCWIGAFATVSGAFKAARSLLPAKRFAMAIGSGRVTMIEDRTGLMPYGSCVDRTIGLARSTGVGRLVIGKDTMADVEVRDAVQRSGLPVQHLEGSDRIWLQTPPAPAPSDLSVPESVGGRYALSEELARGGMGSVHAATDAKTGTDVVVKVLLPEVANDPSYAQRFFWEARIAASLDHANTVKVLDYGADGPSVWLVMERLHGEDLEMRLQRESPVALDLAVDLTIQALDGLGAAHGQDIVHRDVKPGNLFVSEADRPHLKVLDFGIAISVYDDLGEEAGAVYGTPRYLSPEQVDRERLDGRSDVYAMSIVLYEMLCGRLPFEAETARAMALIRVAREATPITVHAPTISPSLAEIVMKGLARERAERWPDARAMADALRRWKRG